jgi:hypothetical protein
MDPSPQLIAIALFFSCILLYNALIKKTVLKVTKLKRLLNQLEHGQLLAIYIC